MLVTEPTPFGLSDFILTVEVLEKLKVPYGVVINRSDIGTQETVDFCKKKKIDILASLPDKRRVAETYSKGIVASEAIPEVRSHFSALYENLKKKVGT